MKNMRKRIEVTEYSGIYRVAAELEKDFHFVPSPEGKIKLAFWDESRMKVFLETFGFYPVISHSNN